MLHMSHCGGSGPDTSLTLLSLLRMVQPPVTKFWVGGQDSKAECDIQMLLVEDEGLTYTSGFSRAKSWGTEVFQLTGVGQGA